MKVIRIILQIGILYLFYLVGVLIVKLTHLPLPPSVIGLLLLFLCLQQNWIKVKVIQGGASFLIGFMTLFFIPAMIGIIDYPELLSAEGIILVVTVIVSTLLAIYITGFFSMKIEKKEKEMYEKKGEKIVESNHIHR